MCQMSFINTKNNELNKLLFVLMGSYGSTIHDDGWGMTNANGDSWKCDLPMYGTWNAGERIAELFPEDNAPLMGHIRKASISVPVNDENAHPFRSENKKILFQHNGTLKPKVEKDFVLEFEEETVSDKGVVSIKKIKISDSLIFFQKFQEIFVGDKTFVDALKETMELFYGKFAFMFYNLDTKQFHIVRGKTADLHICYLLDSPGKDANIIGYVINTSKDLLDMCTTLASNITQLLHKKELYFSKVELIPEETIYLAEEFDITKVGEIKENSAPTFANSGGRARNSAFWKNDDFSHDVWDDRGAVTNMGPTSKKFKAPEEKYADAIYSFMEDFCLSFKDIQYLLLYGYEISTLEMQENVLKHFCATVIPRFRSLVPKEVRKRIHKLMDGNLVTATIYTDPELKLEYPWMLNSDENLKKLIQYLEGQNK